jgi:hypothetical protein
MTLFCCQSQLYFRIGTGTTCNTGPYPEHNLYGSHRSLPMSLTIPALCTNDIEGRSCDSRLTYGMLDTVSTFRQQRSGKCLFETHSRKILDIVTTCAIRNGRLSWRAYAFLICGQRGSARYMDSKEIDAALTAWQRYPLLDTTTLSSPKRRISGWDIVKRHESLRRIIVPVAAPPTSSSRLYHPPL